MNRREFMKQLGTGLLDTFKEAAAPLIEKDLEKLSRLTDQLIGYRFYEVKLPVGSPSLTGIASMTVSGETLLLRRNGAEWEFYSGYCPGCGNLMQVIAYAGKFKCFGCESEYDPKAQRGALAQLPLRTEAGRTYVGLLRRGEVGSHA
jgi:hypothetical protein